MPRAGNRRAVKTKTKTASARIAAWPETRDKLATVSNECNEYMVQIVDWLVADLYDEFKSCDNKKKFFDGREQTG